MHLWIDFYRIREKRGSPILIIPTLVLEVPLIVMGQGKKNQYCLKYKAIIDKKCLKYKVNLDK